MAEFEYMDPHPKTTKKHVDDSERRRPNRMMNSKARKLSDTSTATTSTSCIAKGMERACNGSQNYRQFSYSGCDEDNLTSGRNRV